MVIKDLTVFIIEKYTASIFYNVLNASQIFKWFQL